MPNTIIRDSHLNFNGIKYFRGNADEIELGSYGKKREPVFGMNYLEVTKNFPPAKLKIKDAVIVDIDASSLHEADLSVGANFKILGASGAVKASGLLSKFKSAEVKLVKISVNGGDVVDAVNASPNILQAIDDLGDNARFAHQIFIVAEAKLAQTLTSSGSLSASAEKGDVKIEIAGGGKGSSTTSVVLGEGTTFAYLLLKFKWDNLKKSKRTHITSASDDQWGLA
jgi:hypothetical protein